MGELSPSPSVPLPWGEGGSYVRVNGSWRDGKQSSWNIFALWYFFARAIFHGHPPGWTAGAVAVPHSKGELLPTAFKKPKPILVETTLAGPFVGRANFVGPRCKRWRICAPGGPANRSLCCIKALNCNMVVFSFLAVHPPDVSLVGCPN